MTAEVEEQAPFEALLAELLGRVERVTADDLGSALEWCQARVCEFFDVDRCTLWQLSDWEPGVLRLTHVVQRPGELPTEGAAETSRRSDGFPIPELQPLTLRPHARGAFPWLAQRVKVGETVVLPRIEDVPAEADDDRKSFATVGTKSLVAVPLMADGEVRGVLGIALTRGHREWPAEVVRRLQLVARIFAVVLAHRHTEGVLSDTEARLRLAADAAEIGLWMLDVPSGRLKVSDTAAQLVGLAAEPEITLERLLEVIHPDDREGVRAAVRRAIETGEEQEVEYRVRLPEGAVRWLRSRGRMAASTDRQPPYLLGATLDITERKLHRDALAEELHVETMLSELSAHFVNLPADQVDAAIVDAQRRVCESLGFEVSALWQWSPETPESQILTHLYRPLGGPPVPDRMDAREHFPWCLDEMLAGRAVVVPRTEEAPPEAARDKETFAHFGIKSSVTLPIAAGGGPTLGSLSFNTQTVEHSLTEPFVQRLRTVGEIFANALVRKHAERDLRESAQRLALAVDVAELGFYELRGGKDYAFLDERMSSLLGTSEQAIQNSRDFWLDHIHPDDRESVLPVSRQVLEGGSDRGAVTYRYRHPQRGELWLEHGSRVLARDAQGRATHVVGVLQDITEPRVAREALERAQAHTLAVMNSTEDLIWTVDPERHGLLTWNSGLKDYFLNRLGIKLAVGQTPEVLLTPDFAAKWHAMYSQALAEGRFTAEYSTLAGGQVLLLSIQPVSREGEIFAISVFGKDITELKRSQAALQASLAEIQRLTDRLELENLYFRKEHSLLHGRGRIVGESPAIMEVLGLVEQVAPEKSTVLIEGETGTGKELVAQRIHELSPRSGRPMIKVNCAALPSTLVESELFGREKGAYTGAVSREPGRFEVATGSTIFLDEVAELPLELQAKLLRVLEEGQFERVGSSRTLTTDVRVIAATNRDLNAAVKEGRFRQDLFYRLAIFPIHVPPLRERRGDIPLLVWSAVEEFSATMHKPIEKISRQDMERLQRYDWPGNVRELRNVVERAMILCSGPTLRLEPPQPPTAGDGADMSLDEAQRQQIAKALDASRGRISGPGGAAERLGLKPTTLRSRMKRLRLDPPRQRDDRSSS